MSYCLIDGDSLLANDPEAETLKGETISSTNNPFPEIEGHSFEGRITITLDKPFTFLQDNFVMTIVLKKIQLWQDKFVARISFHGTKRVGLGRYVLTRENNEFLLPVWEGDSSGSDFDECGMDESIYYWSSSGHSMVFFRAMVLKINEEEPSVELLLAYASFNQKR